MTDRETVLADMLSGEAGGEQPRRSRPVRGIPDESVVHLDYNDPDHVYRLTITSVHRRHLDVPDTTIAEIGGIGIRLTSVEVSNDTTVVIDSHDGPSYDADMTAFRAAYERWDRPPRDRYRNLRSGPRTRSSAVYASATTSGRITHCNTDPPADQHRVRVHPHP